MEREWALRRIPVGFAESLKPLKPCVVGEDASLVDTVRASVTSCPGPGTMAVVDSQGRLSGTISRLDLAEEILVRMMAEEFLAEAVDGERAAEFARWSRAQSARDLVGPAVAVRREDTLGEAFTKMHRHRLSGLPIVDQEKRVIGYLDVSALLLAWLGTHGG